MKEELFKELVASVHEGGAILRGEIAPSRKFIVDKTDVKRIRVNYRLSQGQFAALLGISVATLQNWEQGRRQPKGAARVLLQVAAKYPETVWDVVKPVVSQSRMRAGTRAARAVRRVETSASPERIIVGASRLNLPSEPRSQTSVVLPAVESPGIEVHLRGMRAEEALEKLEKHLDRAYLAGLPYVRVVHGKGTGTLKKIARDFMRDSPLVASIHNAEPSEGGDGVTVVKLATR